MQSLAGAPAHVSLRFDRLQEAANVVAPRLWELAAGLAAALAAGSACAQPDAQMADVQMADIHGAGTVTVAGQPTSVSVVSYTTLPSEHRLSFSVTTPAAMLTFSGSKDSQDAGHYSVEIDTIISLGKGESKDEASTGKCDIDISSDGGVVHTIACKATTSTRELDLDFKGDGRPISFGRPPG
jgi:hypothetical protein